MVRSNVNEIYIPQDFIGIGANPEAVHFHVRFKFDTMQDEPNGK